MTNNDQSFGLQATDIVHIKQLLATHPQITEAVIFGSRVLGTHKSGSDIDIALKGDDVDQHIATHLQGQLNDESPLPYCFDVIAYDTISSIALREHIVDHGVVFYTKLS